MDTNRIHQLLVTAGTGNLRKAAEILHISHSGLSKSLRVLERELGGAPLFRREGRGVLLTDRGRELAERAPALLAAEAQFVGAGGAASGPAPLRLATFEVFSTYFLGALCATRLADVPLAVHELLPGHMEAAIAANQADVGITYEPVAHPGIEFLRVARCTMGVFGLARLFAGAALADLPFAVPARPLAGTPTGAKGLDGWPETNLERRIRYRVDLMESALELCRRGLAVAFLPRFIARLHNAAHPARLHLAELSLAELGAARRVHVQRTVYIVKRTATVETRAMKLLAQALREYAAD